MLRSLLMHSFHSLLCSSYSAKHSGNSRYIAWFQAVSEAFPVVHNTVYAFGRVELNVEMLILLESANIPIIAVSVGWKEVKGSRLNVPWDCLDMACAIAIIQICMGNW